MNWPVFWALLAAFAVRGTYRFWARASKEERESAGNLLKVGGVFAFSLACLVASLERDSGYLFRSVRPAKNLAQSSADMLPELSGT